MSALLPTLCVTLNGYLSPGPPRSTQVVASLGDFESVLKVVKEDVSLASVKQWRNSLGLLELGCS